MYSLNVNNVATTKDDDCFTVAFGEASDGSERYVLLQLAREFDDQARNLQMDGIYFEFNSQNHSGYNVLTRIEVGDGTITLDFSTQKVGLSKNLSPLRILSPLNKQSMKELYDVMKLMAVSTNIEFVDNAS